MFRGICRGDETGLADVWTRKQETRQDGRREGIPKDQIFFLPRASVAVFSPVDGDLEEFKGEKCNSMNPAPPPPGAGRGLWQLFAIFPCKQLLLS